MKIFHDFNEFLFSLQIKTHLVFDQKSEVCVCFLNTLKGLSTSVALQPGFLICGCFLPLGSFTSVIPGVLWRSVWGRLAPWRKAASSLRSSSKSSSRRYCYHTSWLWAWGKKNWVLKTKFSSAVFLQFYSVLLKSHPTDPELPKSRKDHLWPIYLNPLVRKCALMLWSRNIRLFVKSQGPILDFFWKHLKVHEVENIQGAF